MRILYIYIYVHLNINLAHWCLRNACGMLFSKKQATRPTNSGRVTPVFLDELQPLHHPLLAIITFGVSSCFTWIRATVTQRSSKDTRSFEAPGMQTSSATASQYRYCWWKKSCTTWHVENLGNSGVNYLSTGAGFLPSTVCVNRHSLCFEICLKGESFWRNSLG